MLATVGKIFGVVLLTVGLLGFVPGITSNGELFGIFHVDTGHNLVHLTTGALALWAGMVGANAARFYFRAFGVVYALVAVLGFFSGPNDVLGFIANNGADNWLHMAIALTALALGYGPFDRPKVAPIT